ncbi:MAG: hypothetical protein KY463_15745 [Actinobacteria bacterium]|nr:hypothetical protein [Actinomycetota bacterium]
MSLTLSTILAVSDNAAGATSEHAAAAEEHHDETPFFIMGAILVAFAVAISIVGFKKPDFPSSSGAARGIMALSVALVAATAFSIVYVSA